MNGRTVFAVNRSPVLAWNVEPPQPLPYADMPAAAAAAISPVVSPADPYARCWQNTVDAGSGFSYFGALYNNSLPPTAYRLQPGCMANLGQFWPPTPPPDGCGRFDGSNLYLGSHVFRHNENIPANLRNSYQGLGHYSHVVEAPKESSQRTFKRETPISPNVSSSGMSVGSSVSKSENNSLYVDSKLKPQVTVSSTLPKQEIIPASTSSHEQYMCAPDSRGSSSMHPSTDKACFSPPYSLKSSINFHNSSQDNSLHKGKTLNGTQENNCNASPLKNVYFSNIESENVNSMSKKFKGDEQYRFESKSVALDVNKSKNLIHTSNSFLLHNSYSSKKYEVPVSQDFCNINSNCKIRADKQADCVLVGEQQYKQRNNVCRVKPEKINHSDCKYQKSIRSSSALPMSEYRTSSDVFNIPTSVMPPKPEPNDKYFLSNCSSAVPNCMTNSYTNTGPYLLKDFSPSYRNIVYPNSCSLSKPWHVNELPMISPESYFKAPEAAKPPVPGPPYSSSAIHEGLISVAQTAPQDIDVIRMNGKLQQGSHASKRVFHESSDDDEVQIISVQTKQLSSSKSNYRHSAEPKTSMPPIVSVVTPLCLKSEKEPDLIDQSSKASDEKIEDKLHWIKSEPSPPVLEKEEIIDFRKNNSNFIVENSISDPQDKSPKLSDEKCDIVSIKKEVTQDDEDVKACDTSDVEQKVFKTEDIEPSDITSEQMVLSVEKSDCSNTSQMPELVEECHENVPTTDFNDNHNLNLLLNTIEKVTSLEKTHVRNVSETIKTECSEEIKTEEMDTSEKAPEIYSDKPKTCGLDLLSVIAGQRLVTEFDGVSDKEDIRSNYPLIKQENRDTSEQMKPSCDTASNLQKATVFEMQDRLVELQKKYKQKQKELSRLKPKKRFASIYLNGRKKSKDENDVSSGSNMDSSDLNSSNGSASDDMQDNQPKDAATNASTIKVEDKTPVQENKGTKRKLPSRKNNLEESASLQSEKRITTRSSSRYSVQELKPDNKIRNSADSSQKVIRNSRSSKSKGYQLRKSSTLNSPDDDVQIISEESPSKSKETSKKSSVENDKNMKAYSLRHSSQTNKKQEDSGVASDTATCSKTIASKRKSDNPKKYMPSKQGKLSETIVAKHLRSRILFDTSGSMSDDDTKDGGVPEELYDALMKCHLEDQSKKEMTSKSLELSSSPLASPEPNRLKLGNLIVKHRLLALEDGLFYAGYIKEVQTSDRYGIALDGQRGNRLHVFSQEELLTQAIVESKPLSSELPEGTRVCAYWSQQYRCLYPGIVGKAPCPSADWSEPRVFVLFDDGDSGQIPTKNIRLIPPDIIPAENDQDCDSPAELPESSSDPNSSAQENAPRRLRCSTAKSSPVKECDTSNENESKDSSCASINDSSCDDSCFIEFSLSPSQNSENYLKLENSACSFSNDTETTKLEKRQRKRSKRKTSCRIKFKEHDEAKEKSETKTKRHKKYKEKHRKHHHHHHHHRHHHHHHHHSKKHKHKKKNVKNFATQDLEKGNFIPCGVSHKSFKNFQVDAEACTNHVEHSSTVNLPQNENDRVC